MSELSVALGAFHFIRPLWLLLLPLAALLWWAVRRRHLRRDAPTDGMAPHLRAALTVGGGGSGRLKPIDGVVAAIVLAALGAAGPTWSRMPNPLVAQSAPVVVALKVASSMEATDIAPDRLERARQKIRDFLDLRAGARTALIAYAGTAHVVVPMADDPAIMVPYLEGLAPEVMPEDGDRAGEALELAEGLLAAEAAPGGILFVTDAVDPADVPGLDGSGAAVAVLSMLPEGARDRGLDALASPVVRVTPDASDLRQLDRMLNAAYRQALLEDGDQPWLDRGPWLAWPVALLILIWFRRGWTMRWAALAALCLTVPMPGPARADGLADWFFTPDQQGQIAMNRNRYGRAAELFADPLRRGYALYRDGQYEEAVQVLDRVETAQAAMIQGIAQIRWRRYRDGVAAFETALERDPDYPGAAENLATAREIVAYIEATQEASDIGEQPDMGADELAFDNEENRGTETLMEVPEEGGGAPLTADQWMNSVDTSTGDFLRQRFALEAAQGGSAAGAAE